MQNETNANIIPLFINKLLWLQSYLPLPEFRGSNVSL